MEDENDCDDYLALAGMYAWWDEYMYKTTFSNQKSV